MLHKVEEDPKRELKTAAAELRSQIERRRQFQEQFKGAAKEFQQRYRKWCLDESQAECIRNFGLTRLVRNDEGALFLDFIGTLFSIETRQHFVTALCKRSCCNEGLSSEEQQFIDKYVQFSRPSVVHSTGKIVTSIRVLPEQEALKRRFYRHRIEKDGIAKQLRSALRDEDRAHLGEIIVENASALWFEKKIAAMYVVTAFEFSGWTQMRYLHTIHALPGAHPGTKIFTGISILEWMGIGQSAWSWLVPDDVPDAIRGVRKLCAHFFKAAIPLLEGLRSQ